jgi:hypothetical protein
VSRVEVLTVRRASVDWIHDRRTQGTLPLKDREPEMGQYGNTAPLAKYVQMNIML